MADFIDEYLADISGRDIDEILKKLTNDAIFFPHAFPAVQGKASNKKWLFMKFNRMAIILIFSFVFNNFDTKSK